MADVEPPAALVEFLDGIKLRMHVDVFMELSYDDVDDFVQYDAAAMQRFRENLLDAGIGPGHVEKITRTIDKLRGVVMVSRMVCSVSMMF